MTARLTTTALSLSLALLAVAPARADTMPHLDAAPPPAAQPAAHAEAPVRATLSNGLRVVVVRDRLAPVVTTEINYLVGSSAAPKGFPGTAHALEHMMFRGSKGLDKDQLAAIGARLGGSYNADTTENVTQYYYTAPADDLGVILHIEALRMQGLTLDAADWDKERGAIEQEVSRDLSSPSYQYLSRLQSILFTGTPYEQDALGTRPSFEKTDAALLRSFYEKWYAPNNAILIIAGDVDPARAIDQVRAAFGEIPRRTLPERAPVHPGPVTAQTLHFPTDYPVGLITVAWRMPGLTARDYAAAQILSDVLSSQRGALYDLVPAGKALFAGFEFAPKADAGIGIAIAAFPKEQDPAPLLHEVNAILATIRDKGVPTDLVEAARRKELAQLSFSANSISGLAENWSQALAVMGLNSPDDLAAMLNAVTPADVNRLARQILDPGEAVTALLTPEDSGKPVTGKGFGGSESFATPPDHPVPLPDWARTALTSLSLPPSVTPPSVFTYPNGLRLIVQPAHVGHTVNVYGMVRQNADMQEPAGQEGIAAITEDLFTYGTRTLDRLAFQKALDDIAATESAGPGFGLAVLTPDFERGMELLADNELHPAFPDRAFQVVRMQTAQALAGRLRTPDYLFGRAVKAAVSPPHDPSLRQPDPQKVMHLTLADVRAFYAGAYRPDLTTIVVAGDITPERAQQVVGRDFGAWTAAGGATPAVDLPTRPDSRASRTQVPDHTSVQDTAMLAESLGLTAAHADHFALTVGNEVLGDGFSSRLYRDLRVRTGYVYSVSSRFSWSRNRGGYSISFGADPDKVGKARDAAVHDVTAMQNNPVSDDELTLAKASLLRGLPLQRASLDSIAAEDLHLVDLGLPLDTPDRAAKAYYGMTAAAVQAAFRTWIRPRDLAEIVKGPAR
ncbi:insulinase family protein [Gluconacetobacter azotocaptans]|uniref:M16 family metallopeptidase n=1 Tax=Gluconacetobacter azotocaptans TaxID=142834 RepID=UPI00195B1C0D|nr:pitrilysin family protein [Gluconacetobacter azotocaptans]MBM9401798.1 insulinase family protein [Gluconacetobacter azotocaptans]